MGAGHSHSHSVQDGQNEKLLWYSLLLTGSFLIVELVGGILSNSLALISDAAHMFTDTAALAISLAAIRIGRRPADRRRTFGYYRFEILAAAFNAILLFLVAIYIVVEAYQRLHNPPEIHSSTMLLIAAGGFVVNLISMRLLSTGKDHSLNVKGAYLEVWSDMLGSVGVMLGAMLIKLTGWDWVDSAVAIAIGLWVLPRTWVLLKQSLNILLEGVPEEVGLDEVEAAILAVPGVAELHDLHVWAITSGKVSVTVHVVSAQPDAEWHHLLIAIRSRLAEHFNIHHSTVQIERTSCEQGGEIDHFGPTAHVHHHGHAH